MAGGTRIRIGVLAVAALGLAASWKSYQASAEQRSEASDPYGVGLAIQRFAAVNRQLPINETIGYLSDLALSDQAGTPAFLTAQYALSPRLLAPVEQSPTAQWAVGNFSRPTDYAAAGARVGFTFVQDTGNGVVLYKRSAR
jgi:hypothetical protein